MMTLPIAISCRCRRTKNNLEKRPCYIRLQEGAWVTWVGRSVTTNHISTLMHGDATIHYYKNAISGISAPFYSNIVSSWMKIIVESQSTTVDGYNIKSRDPLAEYISVR